MVNRFNGYAYQNREGLIKFNFSVEELMIKSTIVEVVRNVYESIKLVMQL